jgi:hypothetical protein
MPDMVTAHGVLYGLLKLVTYRRNNEPCGELPKLCKGALQYFRGETTECACLLTQPNELLNNKFYVERFNVQIAYVILSKYKGFPRVALVVTENEDIRLAAIQGVS